MVGKSASKTNKLIVKHIASYLKGRPVDFKILEISCGKGFLSKQLLDLGYNMTSTNYDDNPVFKELKCDKVDLNDKLPYRDNSFDAIICVEIIEHLRNVVFAFEEFKRILKNNGLCIITTPNVLNFGSRMKFLLTGFVRSYCSPYKLTVKLSDAHINQLTFPEIEYISTKTNFSILKVQTWKSKLTSVLLFPILILPIMIFTFNSLFVERYNHPEFGKSTKEEKKRNWKIFKILSSFSLLFGENIEIVMTVNKKKNENSNRS